MGGGASPNQICISHLCSFLCQEMEKGTVPDSSLKLFSRLPRGQNVCWWSLMKVWIESSLLAI